MSSYTTTNDVFDVYCFYLLIFKLLTHRDDFNQNHPILVHLLGSVFLFRRVFLAQYCAGDKIETNDLGWRCGAYG